MAELQTEEDAYYEGRSFSLSWELAYVDRTDITEIIIILVSLTYLIQYGIYVYFMEEEGGDDGETD